MRHIVTVVLVAVLAGYAYADIMRSSSPTGIQVIGSAHLAATQEDAAAVSIGSGNTARNATATVSGSSTSVRGDTVIKATQKKASAMTYGHNNAAANEAGNIGGK